MCIYLLKMGGGGIYLAWERQTFRQSHKYLTEMVSLNPPPSTAFDLWSLAIVSHFEQLFQRKKIIALSQHYERRRGLIQRTSLKL